MLNIIYSYNKKGFEAKFWESEIAAASSSEYRFIPFNHDPYLSPRSYLRAQLLDNLYYERHPGLMRMYEDLEALIKEHKADVLMVDTCPPYHPDYLRTLGLHKVLRVNDGPMAAYDRDFAYLHAYDQILFHSHAYSRDMGMQEKLGYCGAKSSAFWPLALFDIAFDHSKTAENILMHERDIDIVFVGALHLNKMPMLAQVKRAFGKRLKMHGLCSTKKNLYFNVRYGFPGWVSPIPFDEYVSLYQRAKIGINVHNRGDYTVGGYRLFELPGNGVMQISDGGEYLNDFFKVGDEVVGHGSADDLIDKIKFYLANDAERQRIALNGYNRTMQDHRFKKRMHEAVELIRDQLPQGGVLL